MRLLLDTHTFPWFCAGDRALSSRARRVIEDGHNERFSSVASVWELARQRIVLFRRPSGAAWQRQRHTAAVTVGLFDRKRGSPRLRIRERVAEGAYGHSRSQLRSQKA